MKQTFILTIIVLITVISFAQKWENIFGYPGTDEAFSDVIEYYDNGYLISAYYETNIGCWLIKTDVNGEMLWEKFITWPEVSIFGAHLDQDEFGNIYMASVVAGEPSGFWPMITKLNACGEKVWCRVFPEDDYIFGSYQDVMVLENNNIIALAQFESLENLDQVYLDYIDADGNLLWRQVYATRESYPHIRSCAGDGIHTYGDNYLIHGYCYYPYPSDTTHFYQRPLFIQLDSLFNEQWVLPFGVNDSLVGNALETTLLNDSTYFGTGMLRLEDPVEHSLLMYFNKDGEELGYVEIPNDSIGLDISQNYMNDIERVNDSLFIGLTTFGIDDTDFFWGELIIDITGKIYKQEFRPVGTNGASTLIKTFDDKYTIGTALIESKADFDIYLYKINEELEQDTSYPGTYTYDSLCSETIQSGTVDISNCLIITDVGEVPSSKEYYTNLNSIYIKAFPNPVKEGQISFELQNTEYLTPPSVPPQGGKQPTLFIYNVYGKKVHEERVYQHQGESKVNVSNWEKGMYIAIVNSNGKPAGRCKFVVQ
jgi:hypothetical protein